MNLTENIKLALRTLKSNLLRTLLTVVIIAVGISALIGTFTASEAMHKVVETNFSEMGSNTFAIKAEGNIRRKGGARRNRKAENPPLSLQQVNEFLQNFTYPATVGVSCNANDIAVLVYESKKTNPKVQVVGVDENYLKVSGTNMTAGRNFSKTEIENGSDVVLIGKDIVTTLFEPYDTVIGKLVSIGSKKFKIVGILASKGASQQSSDNMAMIPLLNARYSFPTDNASYVISVMLNTPEELDLGIDEATGVLRGIRHLRLNDENDFDIAKSDRLAGKVLDIMGKIEYAVSIVAILTLLGAGVGLMNIMLVSVNERTREIGISKALGATKSVIRTQFLTEAIVICQIGGLAGIVLGVIIGNTLGVFFKSGFVFPVGWVIAGIGFTFLVGLAAGIYPAIKASDLDPVEALRYE